MAPSVAELSPSALDVLEAALLNTSGNVPLHDRFRALFTLKSLKNEQAIQIIAAGSNDSHVRPIRRRATQYLLNRLSGSVGAVEA